MLGALVAAVALTATPAVAKTKVDVRLTQGIYVDARMSAAKAARSNAAFAPIGRAPQAFWVTDYLTVNKVRATVRAYADLAATKTRTKKAKTPIVAIYGIPQRDCGGASGGGLTAETYPKWIAQIASGLKGRHAIAILEPDALAMLDQCAHQGDRAGLLRNAARTLNRAGVWVYLDAGHSNWQPPSVMAGRLKSAGITYARGFSTNVAGFQKTAAEKAYGKAVIRALNALGRKNKHFVIDTSRNGGAAGAVKSGEFCNPTGARIGTRPRITNRYGNSSLDAYLWVKNPGESDGPCNGGPNAGVWWPAGAKLLLRR